MASFRNRVSTVRGGDHLREGGAAAPPPPSIELNLAMPLYVIVLEGRTQANIGKPDETD